LYGLTTLGLFYAWSAVIAIVISATYNYTLNNKWTFKEKSYVGKRYWNGWVKYCSISFIGDGLYLGFMVLLVEKAHLYYLLAAAISMFTIMLLRFAIVKKLVWRLNAV
jgi:putative flippase GtrA